MSLIQSALYIPVLTTSLYFFFHLFTAKPFIPINQSPHLSPQFSQFALLIVLLLSILFVPFFSIIHITQHPFVSILYPLNAFFTIAYALRHSRNPTVIPTRFVPSPLKIFPFLLWKPQVNAAIFFLTISLAFTISSITTSISWYMYLVLSIISIISFLVTLPNLTVDSDLFDSNSVQTVPASTSNTSAFSLLLFEWVTNTVSTGRVRPLQEDDISPLSERFTCNSSAHRRFKPFWNQELQQSNLRHPSLLRALFKSFGARLLIAGLLKVVNDALIFVAPLLLKIIISFIQEKEKGTVMSTTGLFLASALFITYLSQTLIFNQYFNIVSTVQVLLRGALINTVFEKSCKLSPESRAVYTSGQIQNLMSTDSRTVSDVVLFVHMLWSSVLQILVALTLLVQLLGWIPTVAGVAFITSSIPIHSYLIARIKILREQAGYRTDERVKATSEAIKGIKLVKLYAWEMSFIKRILELRAIELNYIRDTSITNAWSSILVSSLPTILTIIAFVAFAMTGATLNAAVVFPAIALFNVLRPPLLFLPYTIINAARAAASLSRLQKFFLADELKPLNETEYAMDQQYMETNNIAIGAVNASFTWDTSLRMTSPTLAGVSFQIPQGSLVAIIGPTGSGKSTLLAGLLGELPIVSGKAGIREGKSISFCDQVPFIRNETVRDNILFGHVFNAELYEKVIDVCSLRTDLEILPAGDKTEIGGRGVNLSGGQRARISLARAVYSQSDICLLDDPLSAVDASVGRSIFQDCIVSQLHGSTRILTTNQLHYATSNAVDMIIVVKNGAVVEVGTRRELLNDSRSELSYMMKDAVEMDSDEDDQANGNDNDNENIEDSPAKDSHVIEDVEEDEIQKNVISKTTTNTSIEKPLVKDKQRNYGTANTGKLTERESKNEGRVRVKHYLTYLRGMGIFQWVLPLLLFSIGSQVMSLCVNVWLSVWSEKDYGSVQAGNGNASILPFLITFVCLGLLAVMFGAGSSFSQAFGAIRASVLLHEKLLLSVFGAPSSFFNSTPEGRLINRFNADIDKLDNMLSQSLQSLLRLLLGLITTVTLILWATPAFIFFAIPVAAICIYIQEFYRKSSVDLRRLEALARSPLYSHFGETLDGVVTIRAFRAVERATYTNDVYTDQLNRTSYASSYANRWVSVRLEGLGTVLIFGATTLAILAPPGQLSASLSGLVLSYVMQILSSMTWTVRQFTEVESQLSAIERISEYSEPPFPQEEDGGLDLFMRNRESSSNRISRSESMGLISLERVSQLNNGVQKRRSRWPKKGKINFENVVMRYRKDLDPALRSVSFSIAPGEHVGIVGRTGAGKSSAIQSLFRLYELASGRITIDETDISDMRLFDLRSALGIIPQEPFCFSGTIRNNLDMFNEHTDLEIQAALDRCGLQQTMREKVTLDYEIAENGSNLSVGQRQLLCLGRALLKDSQLLVLDEATSNVSTETDERFQETLRTEMEHCTILTVAHRLHTVIQYDRIIVMERGKIAEIGKPSELLSRKSMLSDLVNETGSSTAAHLRQLASTPRSPKNSHGSPSCSLKNTKRVHFLDCEKYRNEQESLRDRVRHAFIVLRTALIDVDTPGWHEELIAANIDEAGWREQLRQMIQKLSILSYNMSHIDPSLVTNSIEGYVTEIPLNRSTDF